MFQCSSASRKFLNVERRGARRVVVSFQCSSASRKFLNDAARGASLRLASVSVLFSEPKIPQCGHSRDGWNIGGCFSALQRAENSSMWISQPNAARCWRSFQCSSASRKFLNTARAAQHAAECRFQCSSASRKFLNLFRSFAVVDVEIVSVLFSEPKIPQSTARTARRAA